MKPSQLIPGIYLFLHSIYAFYEATRAEEYKYNNLQHCIDRVAGIELADVTEHAQLILIERRQLQTLLPHMGHKEFTRLNQLLNEVLEGCRKIELGRKSVSSIKNQVSR